MLLVLTIFCSVLPAIDARGPHGLSKKGATKAPPTKGTSRKPDVPANQRLIEKEILDSILGNKRYDARIRPAGRNTSRALNTAFCDRSTPTFHWGRCEQAKNNHNINDATLVAVNLFVRDFCAISDVKMEYQFQITLRQTWNDQRLSYRRKLPLSHQDKIRYLTMTDASKVWMPDTFFRNEKTGRFHTILAPNLYIRVFPNGDVLYSIRVSLIVSCPMHLQLFPMDEQTCHLNVASWGWTSNDLVYMWQTDTALKFADNLSLPGGFKLGPTGQGYCDVTTATGEYSCLQVDLVFARELSFYIITIYVPTTMIVFVSWFSFWIDHKAVPARVTLGVTTLLAMSTTQASIQNSLPPVAYTKAIDVWAGVCVFFVFSTLLEYALVNYCSRTDAQRKAALQKMEEREMEKLLQPSCPEDTKSSRDTLVERIKGSSPIPVTSLLPSPTPSRISHQLQLWARTYEFKAKKIDVLSRSAYPTTFLLFLFVYWSYYLNQPQKNAEP